MNPRILLKSILLSGLLMATLFTTAQTLKVTLLGTGAPVPSIERFGPSTLVEAGGQKFLFDCGRGAGQRLWQQKIQLGSVNRLFLTHLHSDHVVGIPDLWLTGWIPAVYGRRAEPFRVWGPTGTRNMMQHLQEAFAWDISTRQKEQNKADSGIRIVAHDVSQGVVYNEGGVTITAFTVDHADFIDSALGYRLDYGGHSVVLSGDTRFSNNLVQFARGADVVIHEVAAASEKSVQSSPLVRQILGFHSSPEDAGKVFTLVKPKLAVYSHIVLLTADPSIPPPTTADLVRRTAAVYKGPLQVGEDGMIIDIGNEIKVSPFKPLATRPTEVLQGTDKGTQ